MTMRVRCNHKEPRSDGKDDKFGPAECPAEADAEESDRGRAAVDPHVMAAEPPPGWTSNNGLGGKWKHYCPLHPQPEIAGG